MATFILHNHPKDLFKNLADVGMAQRTHWLTKYTNKELMPHSDMHSITQPHYSTTIPT